MGELSDFNQHEADAEDERYTIYFNIYSLGFDRTFNRDTFRRDTVHEMELDQNVFYELSKLREALAKQSNSQYLRQEFFRLTAQAEVDARLEQARIDHLPPIRWISSSDRAAELLGQERIIRLAAVRYTRAQARQLSDFVGEEEAHFLRQAVTARQKGDQEAAGADENEANELKNCIIKQLNVDHIPKEQFTQVLIRREKLTEFLEIAFALRNCWGDQDGMRTLKEHGIFKRLFK